MKIKYITNTRIPTEKAHGLQIMTMCSELSKQGIELELIIPRRFNSIKETTFKFYKVKNNFKIRKILNLDTTSLSFDFLPQFVKKIFFWIQAVTFSISALRYAEKDSMIYSRDEFTLFMYTLFKKNKLVYEVHSLPEKAKFLYKHVFRKCSRIITINSYLKKKIVKDYKIAKNKIVVAPDSVDLKKFNVAVSKLDARKKLNLPLDKKIVMYTGHLYDWKGADTLAKSAEHIKDKNIIIFFVGGTKKDIKSFKEKYESNKIRIEGRKKHELIPFYLKTADILVLPNSGKSKISKYYTSPLKLFEYMASKRPIIASDLPSIREILNKNNSLLVKADNPKELKKAIDKLINNKKLENLIKNQAFKEVKKYTLANRAKLILKSLKR